MMEPLSVAVHAIANVGALRTGQSVLIFGAGPVGLLAMAVAKGLGASRIVAVDINEERLNFAKGYAATDIYIPVCPPIPKACRLISVSDWRCGEPMTWASSKRAHNMAPGDSMVAAAGDGG